MQIDSLLIQLQNLTNTKITQEKIGKILGVSRSAINQRIKNKSELTYDELKMIYKHYNLDLTKSKQAECKDNVNIQYFTNVIGSCGSGTFEQSQNFEIMQLPTNLIDNYSTQKKYAIINAYGDSMQPTINDNDKLIIEFNREQIIDNRVYVFTFEGKLYIKRLVQNIDEIVIISDNPNKEIFETKKVTKKELNKFNLIGQVVGIIFRELK